MTNLANFITSCANSTYREQNENSNENLYKCWFHATNNHTIMDCVTFQRLDNNEKIRVLMQNGICFNCLRGMHMAKYCKVQRTCDIRDNNKRCGRFHHHSFHQALKEAYSFIAQVM